MTRHHYVGRQCLHAADRQVCAMHAHPRGSALLQQNMTSLIRVYLDWINVYNVRRLLGC